MLEVRNLTAAYGSATVLYGVDITVNEGELVALVGSNGAGKSTLLRTISGLVSPAGGEIMFLGRPIRQLAPEHITRLGLLHVPEGRHVFPDQSAEDNLYLGAYRRLRSEGRKRIRADIEALFERFPQIAERRKNLAGLLSGGEQQILAIARALIARPRLLMLDEPSLGLAPAIIDVVFDTLVHERRNGMTILLVEQLAYAALSIADRGYVLSRGTVSLSGPSQLLLNDAQVRRAYLGEERHAFG
ncbi:MAG TPA: ABC transporter ATP-binding protein [Xanthobacteraceae bacterium]